MGCRLQGRDLPNDNDGWRLDPIDLILIHQISQRPSIILLIGMGSILNDGHRRLEGPARLHELTGYGGSIIYTHVDDDGVHPPGQSRPIHAVAVGLAA